jgi:hypothetical protein
MRQQLKQPRKHLLKRSKTYMLKERPLRNKQLRILPRLSVRLLRNKLLSRQQEKPISKSLLMLLSVRLQLIRLPKRLPRKLINKPLPLERGKKRDRWLTTRRRWLLEKQISRRSLNMCGQVAHQVSLYSK